eukprot:GEMP01073325.1.p1 GENE.GEMP01073325.1~~GEMP01073325.1.p1  ORF type:complete len:164 (+),score=27.20 GEMP01073325.1:41-532(+)
MTSEAPPLHKSVAASTFSVVLGKVFTHPIDTVKAKVQVAKGAMRSPLAVYSRVLRQEGVRGLFRGYGIACVGAIPAGGVYMASYEVFRVELKHHIPLAFAADFAAGLAAETLSCIFWLPVDVIKERLQVQSDIGEKANYHYRHARDACRQIFTKEGIRGLYRA